MRVSLEELEKVRAAMNTAMKVRDFRRTSLYTFIYQARNVKSRPNVFYKTVPEIRKNVNTFLDLLIQIWLSIEFAVCSRLFT